MASTAAYVRFWGGDGEGEGGVAEVEVAMRARMSAICLSI